MSMARLTIERADESCSLVEQYDTVSAAARAAKIPRSTLLSRLDSAAALYGFEPHKPRILPGRPVEMQLRDRNPANSNPLTSPQPINSGRLGGTAADRKIIALTDEVGRLSSALREAHREQINDDGVRGIIGTLAAEPAQPPPWIMETPTKIKDTLTPEVPVTMFADWHLGEVVKKAEVNGINEYNLEIAEKRVQHLMGGILNICRNHGVGVYPGIVVNLAGDFVSGGIHPELAKTDEENIQQSVLRATDLLFAALTRLADEFGQVYCPAVSGNHGRQTNRPEFKRYQYQNWDWMIYQFLIRRFMDKGDKRVIIDVRPSNDVHYRVFGIRYLLVHGDMLGVRGGDGIIGSLGPVVRGEVKKSRQSAAIGLDYEVLLMAHWHQQIWLRRVIVSNCLIGFNEYAKLSLGAMPTPPTQPLWFVHPARGMTSQWDIAVDDPTVLATDWLSVFGVDDSLCNGEKQ